MHRILDLIDNIIKVIIKNEKKVGVFYKLFVKNTFDHKKDSLFNLRQ